MPVEALSNASRVQPHHLLSRDREKFARFLAEILGLDVGEPAGMFLPVVLANGVTLDFATVDIDIPVQHYAFLVSEDDFDGILARLVKAQVPVRPTRRAGTRAGSTATTAGAACTSRTRPVTAWRSSPAPTAVIRPRS